MEKRTGDVEGKTALVTGASGGFGLLIALELAALGYRVAAGYRRAESESQIINAAKEAGVENRLLPVMLDVCLPEQIEQAVRNLEAAWGRLDLLVNNAGEAIGGFVEEVPLEAWRRQFDVNLFGTVAVTQAALPLMRKTGAGRVILISSISGVIGFPGYGPYASSKFAVEGFGECLSMELSPLGIDVVLLEPGAYGTAIWDKGFGGLDAKKESPYRESLEHVLEFSRRTAAGSGDPAEVAALVGRIALVNKPRFRYRLPRGSRLTMAMKQLLPFRVFQRLVLKMISADKR